MPTSVRRQLVDQLDEIQSQAEATQTQALVAAVLVQKLKALDLRWPEVSTADHAANVQDRAELEAEPVTT